MTCPHCGGEMEGDGYNQVIRCENSIEEVWRYEPPDAGPFYCGYGGKDDEEEQ